MRIFLTYIALLAITSTAYASCIGGDTFKTCTDASGNSYSVQKFGNMTTVQGSNAQGETWSQQSHQFGNTTYHSGTAKNGNHWNGTTTAYGGTTVNQGINSQGQSYQKTCNQFGCY